MRYLIIGCLLLSGCGYALVKIPQPGERVSITSEQRLSSTFETGIESAIEPASAMRRLIRRE